MAIHWLLMFERNGNIPVYTGVSEQGRGGKGGRSPCPPCSQGGKVGRNALFGTNNQPIEYKPFQSPCTLIHTHVHIQALRVPFSAEMYPFQSTCAPSFTTSVPFTRYLLSCPCLVPLSRTFVPYPCPVALFPALAPCTCPVSLPCPYFVPLFGALVPYSFHMPVSMPSPLALAIRVHTGGQDLHVGIGSGTRMDRQNAWAEKGRRELKRASEELERHSNC